MKKSIIFALPMAVIMASCSAKIITYKDIFRDARELSSERKEEIIAELSAEQEGKGTRQYRYSGSRTVFAYMDEELIGRKENAVSVNFSDDEEYSDIGFTYTLDGEIKYQAYYDMVDQVWVGTAPSGVGYESMFYSFKNLVYAWRGHIQTGNFDVAPYDYNTKLLNCVSARFSKQDVKHVASGTFGFNLNRPASYSDGDIKYKVHNYVVDYVDYRITSYTFDYSIIIEDAGIEVRTLLDGTFDYNYIH